MKNAPAYAADRLRAAAQASLEAWEGAGLFPNQQCPAVVEELESALFYFDAHGEKVDSPMPA